MHKRSNPPLFFLKFLQLKLIKGRDIYYENVLYFVGDLFQMKLNALICMFLHCAIILFDQLFYLHLFFIPLRGILSIVFITHNVLSQVYRTIHYRIC